MAANNQGNSGAPDQDSDKSAGEINNKPDAFEPILNLSLRELVHKFTPTLLLDEDAENMLHFLADEFIETSLNKVCDIAIRTGSKTIELKHLQIYLKMNWDITVPPYGDCVKEVTPEERAAMTERHLKTQARMREIFGPK